MAAYLVTGAAGCGKSTLMNSLQQLGYTAYDTDGMPEVTRWLRLSDGQPQEPPAGQPIDFSRYGWHWQKDALERLLTSDTTVFIAAVVGNQAEYYNLFDTIFVLSVSSELQRHRLQTRTNNDFGKLPGDLADTLRYRQELEDDLRARGAIIINGAQPPAEVAQEVLRHVD